MTDPSSKLNAKLVPEDFKPIETGYGFTDILQPSYLKANEEQVAVGFFVQKSHCNMMGMCHGGVVMTLADVAAACAINYTRGVSSGNPTINLSVDFINSSKEGEWIQANNEHISVKRRFGFASGVIVGEKGVLARYNGTFYLPEHDGVWKDGKKMEGMVAKSIAEKSEPEK